jgi:hypothetical protein
MHRGNGPGSAVSAAALRGPRTDHSPTTESSPVLDGAEPLTFLMSTAAQLGRRARTAPDPEDLALLGRNRDDEKGNPDMPLVVTVVVQHERLLISDW